MEDEEAEANPPPPPVRMGDNAGAMLLLISFIS